MNKSAVNRQQAPALQVADKVELGRFEQYRLTNGVPVYFTHSDGEDIVKIECAFAAGRWYEPAPMVSRATIRLLTQGTSTHSSKQLADEIEFYGASVDTDNGHDHTSVKIFVLRKHLSKVLPLVKEMLEDAIFPEEELNLFKSKQVQKLRVGLQNTDFVANRTMHEKLFGPDHPYGYAVNEDIIAGLNRAQLLAFSSTYYQPARATLFLSGNITLDVLQELETHFGSQSPAPAITKPTFDLGTAEEQEFLVLNEQSVQSSIRFGGLTINKHHEDFPALNVANTVLGGYFGSRLMSNIREEKGYTYGIFSMIKHHREASFFVVDTEVGNEVCQPAVEEIMKEMDKLCHHEIDDQELTVVRNYMTGSLIRATDGPFNRIKVIRNMVLSDLDVGYFSRLVEAVQQASPASIREMADRYLQPGMYKRIICGNPVSEPVV